MLVKDVYRLKRSREHNWDLLQIVLDATFGKWEHDFDDNEFGGESAHSFLGLEEEYKHVR